MEISHQNDQGAEKGSSDGRSLSRRKLIPDNVYALAQLIDSGFEDLIRKVGLLIDFFEHKSEEEPLKVEVHSSRSIDADEAGMERNIGEHSFRARRILRPTKIFAIPGNENPVLVEQELLQFPVLPP